MKKLFAFFLVLILVFHSCGGLIVFKLRQAITRHEIKQQIKKQVPAGELAVIIQTQENKDLFDWIEDHEFRFQGTMYDVVRQEKDSSGAIIYYCITDHQETQLFAQLDEWVQKCMSSDPGTDGVQSLLKLLAGVYLLSENEPICIKVMANLLQAYKPDPYSSHTLEITVPPPRTA